MAARRDIWQQLNHTYRDLYKAHREAQDAATQAAWQAAHPDQLTSWQKLRKLDRRPPDQAASERSITFPVFEASPAQRENMMALLQLIQETGQEMDLEQVVLLRELGQFEKAARALQLVKEEDRPSLHMLSSQLIEGRHAAPVRYRPGRVAWVFSPHGFPLIMSMGLLNTQVDAHQRTAMA